MRARLAPFAILAFAVGMFAAAVPLSAAAPQATARVYSVDLVLVRTDGARLPVRAEVQADSFSQAAAAARQALDIAAPSALVGATSSNVTTAWLPWSWQWNAAEIPVPVAYNPEGAPLSVAPSMILAGLQAWSSVESSSFRYHYAGVTNNTASILDSGPDGENVISWKSLPCDQGCVLGITSKESAHEVDMLLNSNPQAAEQLGVGTRVDWRTVIVHELGHMAGLEHSCPVPFGPCTEAESDAVMYFQYRGILRKLAPDDIAGISALYPLGSAATATPPPVGTPTPTPFPELVVILESGWNLVVLPAGPVSGVAGSLPCLEALYEWRDEAWAAWVRGLPQPAQDVPDVVAGRAYWAYSRTSCGHVFP